MKYVLMFTGSQDDPSPSPEVYGRIMEWFQTNGSKIVGGEELQGISTATTVRFTDGKPVVTDGPFIETKEVISGYAEVEVADLDEAIALAKGWPGQGAVEIRPTVDHSPN